MPRRAAVTIATLLALVVGAASTVHAQPAPTGAHPRILLDDALRATWKRQGAQADTAARRAIDRCKAARTDPKEYERDSYMGFDWSSTLQACLVAWVATGDDADAKTAIRFFTALLDDLQFVGDGKGGELAVRRDSGYAIRGMVPYTAIAYDWLHDHPAMTEKLRAHARERFTQWLTWYAASGYHARTPATNYHAGYTLAATMVAVAEAGEGGAFAEDLWRLVVDELWGKDMKRALAPGGVLDGGDFPEGWQYGPLSVGEYALAWRVLAVKGVRDDGVERWLEAMLVRTVHALSAVDRGPALGDADDPLPSLAVHPLTLTAILVGGGPPAAQRQAMAELRRLKLTAKDYPLYESLAEAREVKPEPVARDRWPTSYFTPGHAILYARTSWRQDAVWMAIMCNGALDADHTQPNAGNVVLTRGVDEVLIDPSPYGSMSTLTSNAPTVESKQLPPDYHPSQAYWSVTTGFAWAWQSARGVVATRCDYGDQFKFQDTPTDVPNAQRDIIVVPWGASGHATDATAIVIDRADSGDPARALWLRFRAPSPFTLDKQRIARAKVGASTLTVRRVLASGGTPEVRTLTVADCFVEGVTRGGCDASRVPIGEYRLTVPGPQMDAVHLVDAGGGDDLGVEALSGAPDIMHLRRGGADAYVALREVASYATPVPAAGAPAIHVIDPVSSSGPATVSITGAKQGDHCAITVGAGASAIEVPAKPAVFSVDDQCRVALDAAAGPAAPTLDPTETAKPLQQPGSGGTGSAAAATPRAARSGCCDASPDPRAPIALAIFVLAAITRRRRAHRA